MILNKKAKAILSVLNSQPLNTTAISKKVKVPRTTVEYILRTLKKSGYTHSEKRGQATVWEMINKTDSSNDVYTIHGIKNILRELKSAVNKNGLSVFIVESDTSMQMAERKNFNNLFADLNKRFHEKKCLLYILFHEKTIARVQRMKKTQKLKEESISALMNRGMSAYVLPNNLFDINIHIAAIGDKIFLTDFSTEKSIALHNPLFALFIKHFFELMSYSQKRADVGKILNEIGKVK